MRTLVSSLRRGRPFIAAAGLLALGTTIAIDHAREEDPGLAAAEIDDAAMQEAWTAMQADGLADESGLSRAYLIDFVDPQDGEDGSEEAIEDLVAEINARGEILRPAGFYSETEHLYRLAPAGLDTGDKGATVDLLDALHELEDEALVEGWEPEIFYALPDAAISALDQDIPSDIEPHKGPRFDPDDPMFPLQWHMEQIRVPEAWPSAKGEGVVVAVIDTGVAYKT